MAKVAHFARLVVEQLEDRLAPAIFGTPWPDPGHLSLSFAPDGTLGGISASNLFQTLNAVAPTSTWELQILRAFQTWAQYGNINANPANQYNGLFGGNALLTPEKADTITAGAIIQPSFIPGLALTADYFTIKVKNLIGAPSFAGTFSDCFGGDASACARINRNPNNGSLWQGISARPVGWAGDPAARHHDITLDAHLPFGARDATIFSKRASPRRGSQLGCNVSRP